MKNFIHALIVLAFVSVGISPACQFVSGKSLYEICSLDEVKSAPVDPALLAYLPDQEPETPPAKAQKQCGFCFAQTHLTPAQIQPVTITQLELSSLLIVLHNSYFGNGDKAYAPQNPRGPPSLFV